MPKCSMAPPEWNSNYGRGMIEPMANDRDNAKLLEQFQVLRAQTGDASAHAELFRAYHNKLLYYLRRLLKEPAEAEDVLQEVWLTVLRRIASLEAPGAFRTWLYRIARNHAISRLRRTRNHLDLDEVAEDKLLVVEPQQEQAEEELVSGYDAASVHRAMGRLTPPHREVLTLRFLEQLTYDEVAEVVGCSVGTIRSRIHYAKKSLKDALLTRAQGENR